MENLYQLDQLSMEIPYDYNPRSESHLDYQQTQSSRQFESNTYNPNRLPHIPISSTSLPTTMDWTNSYPIPDFNMDSLANEWSETQMVFGHDWGETQIAFDELNPLTAQAEFHLPSQQFWPLDNLQSDNMFDEFPSEDGLLGSRYPTQALLTTWNYPTPIPRTPSTNSGQHNYQPELNEILEKPCATAEPWAKTGYTCETCGRTYNKSYLLK
jgi:hypothetical protein